MKKIALINAFLDSGGAARFTQTLLSELKKDPRFESQIFDQSENLFKKCSLIQEKVFNLLSGKTRGFLWNNSIGVYSHSVSELENFDIIHLNWVASRFYKLTDISSLGIPVVWTIHDLWPITGGCHVYSGCQGYTKSCEECPNVNAVGQIFLVNENYKIKRDFFKSCNLILVAPSSLMQKMILESNLISHEKVVVIPNPIANVFYECRNKFQSKRSDVLKIGVVAMGLAEDSNKGCKVLQDALKAVSSKINYELHIVGNEKIDSHFYYGVLTGEKLAQFYQMMDVVVVPSRFESFGLVGLEALVSGRPVVVFDSTGACDYVDHKVTGYIAKNSDPSDLAQGIEFCFEHNDHLRKNIAEKSFSQYSPGSVAQAYLGLYEQMLGA